MLLTKLGFGSLFRRRESIRPSAEETLQMACAEPAARRFIMYSHARSGSTLLIRALKCHPEIGVKGEALHPRKIHARLPGFEYGMDPVPYVERLLFTRESAAVRVAGFKLFPEHIDCNTGMKSVWEWMKKSQDIAFICLHRENLLRYYTSHLIAQQRGKWRADPGEELGVIRVRVDPQEAEQAFRYRLDTIQWAVDHLPAERTLHTSYEQMNANTQAWLLEIQRHLGVEPCELPLDWIKQETRSLPDIIENYRELEAAWRGTAWARFLED